MAIEYIQSKVKAVKNYLEDQEANKPFFTLPRFLDLFSPFGGLASAFALVNYGVLIVAPVV